MTEELLTVLLIIAIVLLMLGIYCVFHLLSYIFTKKKEQNTIEPPSFEESMGEQKT